MLARDENGELLFGGAKRIQDTHDAEMAEADGVLWSFQVCINLVLSHIIIEMDCLSLYNKIQGKDLAFSDKGLVITKILSLAASWSASGLTYGVKPIRWHIISLILHLLKDIATPNTEVWQRERGVANREAKFRPKTMEISELWAIFGPGFAGAVFGAGWWFWVDAVVCSSVTVSFLYYLPGIFASLAALMFNCVRKEDIDYSPYDEGEWRLKLWLFLAYVVSFVSLAASVGLLIKDSVETSGPSAWTGTAGVLQCVFVLISGLIYWTSHSDDGGNAFY